jgi:endonuclease YncB( thermonuclease family)
MASSRSIVALLILLFISGLAGCSTAPEVPPSQVRYVRSAEGLTGRVVSVQDGDSLTLLTASREQFKIRLASIDAPELRQPYGQQSKQALSALVFGREVHVLLEGTDRYQRHLGRVMAGTEDVNLAMVRLGFAWCYRQYSRDPALLRAEQEARSNRAGLWADPHPVPPWESRRRS